MGAGLARLQRRRLRLRSRLRRERPERLLGVEPGPRPEGRRPFRVAVRGELLHDPDQYIGDGWDTLSTGTLTLDVRPIDNVIIRLDNRVEHANTAVFTSGGDLASEKTWFSSVLGVVVTSDP